ncbi:MAG: hypothetical protein IT290_09835 [Deltaproteobacteria bacterium]|nr:hypothetical protein [Deltaproteobacteria bacterium]
MRPIQLLFGFLLLFFGAALALDDALAQPAPPAYMPTALPPDDDIRFPYDSDVGVGAQAFDSLTRHQQMEYVGQSIPELLQYEYLTGQNAGMHDPQFDWRRHPWQCGNPNTQADWIRDTHTIIDAERTGPGEIFRGCFARSRYVDDPLGTRNSFDWEEEIDMDDAEDYLDDIDMSDTWDDIDDDLKDDDDACIRVTHYVDPPDISLRGYGPGGQPPGDHNRDFYCCVADPEIMNLCEGALDREGDPLVGGKGSHIEIHWPGDTISVNNFGISGFNPLYECGNERYARLRQNYDRTLIDLFMQRMGYSNLLRPSFRPLLRDNRITGQTHFGGMLPTDQTYTQEAHVYRTYLDVVAEHNKPANPYKGYELDCKCFYNTQNLREKRIVSGWTEEMPLLALWRSEELSRRIDPWMYDYTAPRTAAGSRGMRKWGSMDPNYLKVSSCLPYKATRWPRNLDLGLPMAMNFSPYMEPRENFYGDILTAFNILPLAWVTDYSEVDAEGAFVGTTQQSLASRQCYRGGGELYPLTGKISGQFSELPGAALIARRAIELMSIYDNGVIPRNRRINYYSDNFDKMQRIFPLNESVDPRLARYNGDPSECFRVSEIPNYILPSQARSTPMHQMHTFEGDRSWPKDIIRPTQMGEKRFVRYERQRLCMCPHAAMIEAYKVEAGYCGDNNSYEQVGRRCEQIRNEDTQSCHSANDGDWGSAGITYRTDGNDIRDVPDYIPYPFIDNPSCPVNTSAVRSCGGSTTLCPLPGS